VACPGGDLSAHTGPDATPSAPFRSVVSTSSSDLDGVTTRLRLFQKSSSERGRTFEGNPNKSSESSEALRLSTNTCLVKRLAHSGAVWSLCLLHGPRCWVVGVEADGERHGVADLPGLGLARVRAIPADLDGRHLSATAERKEERPPPPGRGRTKVRRREPIRLMAPGISASP
jgi:hypothetical protein